ncbi:MAG: cobaltochelatase subunit CobN [Bacillota bacterium]
MQFLKRIVFRKIMTVTLVISLLLNIYMVPTAKAANKTTVTLILGSASTYVPQLSRAYSLLLDAGYQLDVKYFSAAFVRDYPDLVKERLEKTDTLLLEMIGGETMLTLGPMIQEDLKVGGKAYITNTTTDYSGDYGRLNYSQSAYLKTYFSNSGIENMRRLLLWLGKEGGLAVQEEIAPIASPLPAGIGFIYHPDAVNLPFNPDQFHLKIKDALNDKDEFESGQVVNTAYYSVYEAVYEIDEEYHQEYDKDFALRLAARVIHNSLCLDEEEQGLWDIKYHHFQQADNFLDSVSQSVYESVYEPDKKPAVIIDAAWNVWYDGVRDGGFAHGVSPGAGDLSAAINSLLESEPENQPYPDLANELKTIIQTTKNTIPDLEGVFETLPAYQAWYDAAGKKKQEGPWIGVTTQRTWYVAEDIQMQMELLRKIEDQGGNIIFAIPPTSSTNRDKFVRNLFMIDGQTQIDVLITVLGFNFYGTAENSVALLKELGVPVIAPTQTSSLEDWENNPYGTDISLVTQVVFPEMDGRIEPIFLGGIREVDDGEGNLIERRVPLDYNTNRLAGRAFSWAKLARAKNEDKKIAVIYYNHDGGKDGIKAAYLNVLESASELLTRLKEEGYAIDGDTSTESLQSIINAKGRNVGSWAPGEINRMLEAGAMTIPLEDYLEWYDTLPQKLRDQVEEQWGPAPGNIMVHNDRIVLPGHVMGNIFFGPQPIRGWGDDPDAITHSPILPPPHQYIAFYFWLQNEFKADAVIHLGTHGTLEWLPGRSVGQGEDDWPDQLIGNMVNVYPYIMNNPGEATQAKRRSYGVTIGHLIPPMIEPGLYGELQELQDLMIQYMDAVSAGNEERAQLIKENILAMVEVNNLQDELGVSLHEDFDEAVESLHHYLEEIAGELMPYGLHVLGRTLDGEILEQMIDSIVGFDRENRDNETQRAIIRNKLLEAANEINGIVNALNGMYIEPGPARDPIRVPDAMPTGRNLVTFDPREMPDRIAWEIGKKAADALVESYFQETGAYPDTIGVILWAIETMRTRGETVALILRLIGAEPVYDQNNRVNTIKVTPLEELGRPRIDVLVTISGLFRDTFPNVIEILDDAFRLIAGLDEDPAKNKIRKNYLIIKEKLISAGMDETDAEVLAASRLYGAAPGTYGTGVAELAETTTAWENEADLVQAYMNRMSYIYGRNIFGQPAPESFTEVLKNVSVVTQIRDSIWGVLDNDDVAQYLGGLRLAAMHYSGQDIIAYIINTRSGDPKIQTLAQFIATELRSRVFNPKWIEGMLKEGYAGAAEIGDHIKNMFLIDATLSAIDDWAWQKVVEIFVFDADIRQQLDPYILQSIIGWTLEAARRDMWNADSQILRQLADTYIQTAVDYGVVCCHHTCGNITFNEWAASFSMLDSQTMNMFKNIFKLATDKDLDIAAPPDSTDSTKDRNRDRDTEHHSIPEEDYQEIIEIQEPAEDFEIEITDEDTIDLLDDAKTPIPSPKEEVPEEEQQIDLALGGPADAAGTDEKALAAQAGESQDIQDIVEELDQDEAQDEAAEGVKRAYELEVDEGDQNPAARTAVAFSSIILGLALVGLIARGYFKKRQGA